MKTLCREVIECCKCPNQDTCNAEKYESVINRLFSSKEVRYGGAEIKIFYWNTLPSQIHTVKEAENYINASTTHIEELEDVILMLKAYQIALTERYNFLQTAPMGKKIKLQRVQRYRENVKYILSFFDVNLLDGYENLTKVIEYQGKERSKAISEFEKLKNNSINRQVIFELDIKKK